MVCEWCRKTLDSWYLTYKGKVFCRDQDDKCLKNYLFEEHDKDIGMDKVIDDYYEVTEGESF